MLILSSTQELSIHGAYALAIGAFDGLHRGHQRVIEAVREEAQRTNASPAILYFSPTPKQLLQPEHPPKQLLTDDYRRMLLESYGIHTAVVLPFTKDFAALSPQEFLRQHILPESGARLTAVCVGDDWHFGHRNSGDAAMLSKLLQGSGIAVHICPQVYDQGLPISSTRIRALIAAGKLIEASGLLGRPYALHSRVIPGRQLAGSALACPTANIDGDLLQLPPYGVYAARVTLAAQGSYTGIVYIGDAPTIRGEGNGHALIELHLFGFNGNLYNQEITVTPVLFLRESRHFPSQEALKQQIAFDIAQTKDFFARNP